MKELLKDFVFNPIILPLILLTIVVYLHIFINRKEFYAFARKYEKALVSFLLVFVSPITLFGFRLSLPARIASGVQSYSSWGLTFLLAAIGFYCLNALGLLSLKAFIISLKKNPLLIILTLTVFSSSLWSETPWLVIKSGMAFLLIIFLSAKLAWSYSWLEIEIILRYSLSSLSLLGMFSYLFLNFDILEYGAKTFGVILSLASALWALNFIFNLKQRILSATISAFCGIFVFRVGSLAGELTFFCLFTFLLIVLASIFWNRRDSKVILFVLLSVFTFFSGVTSFNYSNIAISLGKDPTLTGRTEIWEILLNKIHDRPFGYGYNGFWQPWRGLANPGMGITPGFSQYEAPHAHNGFIEIGLQLGYLGFAIFSAIFLLLLVKSLIRLFPATAKENVLPFMILLFLGVSNIAETQWNGLIGPNYTWLLLSLLIFKMGLNEHSEVAYRASGTKRPSDNQYIVAQDLLPKSLN